MLLLWVVISAALVAVVLVLNEAAASREAFRRDSRQAAQSFIWTDKRT